MNAVHFLALITTVLCLTPAPAQAQYKYFLTLSGSCATTNGSGRILNRPLSARSVIQEYATANGITNVKSLALAYHLQGDERGDVIEIVDKTTGQTIYTVLSLFFGTSFGRESVVSADGQDVRRIDYVYGHQIDHSVGSTVTTAKVVAGTGTNAVGKLVISGTIKYILLPDRSHGLRICNGTFKTGNAVPNSGG